MGRLSVAASFDLTQSVALRQNCFHQHKCFHSQSQERNVLLYEKVSITLPPLCTSPSGTPHFFHNDALGCCFSDPELSADLRPSQACDILSQFVIFLIQK